MQGVSQPDPATKDFIFQQVISDSQAMKALFMCASRHCAGAADNVPDQRPQKVFGLLHTHHWLQVTVFGCTSVMTALLTLPVVLPS